MLQAGTAAHDGGYPQRTPGAAWPGDLPAPSAPPAHGEVVRALVGLRAGQQCWRCDARTLPLALHGDIGRAVPLFTCHPCRVTLGRLYTAAMHSPRSGWQCWRCTARDRPMIVHGQLTGPSGAMPLHVCLACDEHLARLYSTVTAQPH